MEKGEEALKLWKEMRPQIEKIINKVENFSTYMERADYVSQSYLACLEAVKHYDVQKATNMSLKTFAFWFILKELNKMADSSRDVVYIATPCNETQKQLILTNSQYRKQKTLLEKNGYVITSERVTMYFDATEMFAHSDFNGNGNVNGNGNHRRGTEAAYDNIGED